MIPAYFRMHLLDGLRTPMTLIGPSVFPALALVFFVIPQPVVSQDPVMATTAVGQVSLFSVMSLYLFQYGVGISEERATAWTSYRRTLPAGAGPDFVGRGLMSVLLCVVSLIPVLVIGALFTEATVTVGRALAGIGLVVLCGLPFLGMGLTMGYLLSSTGAVIAAQLIMFPLAFVGGLFLPPQMFPGWVDVISQGTVTRAARDLLTQITTGVPAPSASLWVLLAWTVAMGGLAFWAYRRDEGRNYS